MHQENACTPFLRHRDCPAVGFLRIFGKIERRQNFLDLHDSAPLLLDYFSRVDSFNARMMSSRAIIPTNCLSDANTGKLRARTFTINCKARVRGAAGSICTTASVMTLPQYVS